MFCPSCHAEYREGFTRCSDCDALLIAEPAAAAGLAGNEIVEQSEYERLWSGNDPVLFEEVCSTLREEGIPFRDARESNFQMHASTQFPFGPLDLAIQEVMVPHDRLDFARNLIAPFIEVESQKFCPLCKAEHFDDFVDCTDCGIPLITDPREAWKDPAVVLWCGFVSRKQAELSKRLEAAHFPAVWDHISGQRKEFSDGALVLVRRSDFSVAHHILAEIYPEPAFGVQQVSVMPGFLSRISESAYPAGGLAVDVWSGEALPDETSPSELFEKHDIPFAAVGRGSWLVPPEYEQRAQEAILELIG